MESTDRDELFRKAQLGEMTPKQAEAEAARLGLGPLAPLADPAAFNPMNETWWTLVMACAWIARRAADAVRDSWDAYRTECCDWHYREWRIGFDGPIHAGYFPEYRKPATLSLLSFKDRYDSLEATTAAIRVRDAKSILWKALGEGIVTSVGRRRDNGLRIEIPASEWQDLENYEERGRDIVARPRTQATSGYDAIAVPRRDVVSIWPPRDFVFRVRPLPEHVKPHGPGYMPLFCAAQWIATRGETLAIDPNDESVWQKAYGELLARIMAEDVRVIGVQKGKTEEVSGFQFATCRIEYPYSVPSIELIFSDALYLSSTPYSDDDSLRGISNDALRNRTGDRWTQLMVLKSGVARYWPFSSKGIATEEAQPITRTGTPGRPTSIHIVEAEHRARWERGEAQTSITSEAEILSRWLRTKHPNVPQLTPKTIANRLRTEHRVFAEKARK